MARKKEVDWQAVAIELFSEFAEFPHRIGTRVNEPPYPNGKPVMVHKAYLDPKRYRQIYKMVKKVDRG